MQGVLDGEALAQELRVPGELEVGADRRDARLTIRVSRAAVPTGTVDLPTSRALRADARGERGEGGVDVAQVRGVRPGRCGVPTQRKWTSPNCAGLVEVGGEAQPAGGEGLVQLLGQAGLEERDLAGARAASILFGSTSTPSTSKPRIGHADGVRGAEVAGADDGDPGSGHGGGRKVAHWFLSS